jgi:segregation and condensation protein B
VPEISEIRGVDSGGVIATLLDRKLIGTAGRKQVIGRPILYKTTKEFLMRFGLKDVNELPSMEEFEKLVTESFQAELIPAENAGEERASSQGAISTDEPTEHDIRNDEEESSTKETEESGTRVPPRNVSASGKNDGELVEPEKLEESTAHRES